MKSLRSFMSLSGHSKGSSHLWSRSSNERKKGGSDSESGLVIDGQGSGHWQKLGKMDDGDLIAHNVVDIAGGPTTEVEDLKTCVQQKDAASLDMR